LRAELERHAEFVLRSLCQLGVREQDTDDALERVFMLACQHVDPRDVRLTRGVLHSICRRVALGLTLQSPAFPHDGAHVRDCEALAFGQRLLGLLPPDEREVFVLYEVEELPTSEIAQALDCPTWRARVLLRQARERIIAEVERIAAESQYD
jgi:RNA polymerase sigma-70 factor (ECF subfamily)